MSREDLQRQYAAFFKSEAGIDLLKHISDQIEDAHVEAEENPANATEQVLLARAARDVKDHITRMCNAAKKEVVR